MPTKTQINKNLELSEKLLDYLSDNPRKTTEQVSYIVITKDDAELNQVNLELGKSMAKHGKKVIKALETKDKANPWKFATI